MNREMTIFVALAQDVAVDDGSTRILVLSLKLIFSWLLLMPIAVIVAGKMLAQKFRLSSSGQVFSIPIGRVLKIQARNDEVLLGFAGFIVTLLVLGLSLGSTGHLVFVERFGVDPGHFNSLCILSSFVFVAWSSLVFGLNGAFPGSLDKKQIEYERLVGSIAESSPNEDPNEEQ